MNKIIRYEQWMGEGGGVVEEDDGSFVAYEDYERLRERLDEIVDIADYIALQIDGTFLYDKVIEIRNLAKGDQ